MSGSPDMPSAPVSTEHLTDFNRCAFFELDDYMTQPPPSYGLLAEQSPGPERCDPTEIGFVGSIFLWVLRIVSVVLSYLRLPARRLKED